MRSRNRLSIAVAVVALAGAAMTAPAATPPPPLERVGVEVTIALSDPTESIYECRAVVTDLAGDEVVSAPTVLFRPGDDARLRTGTRPGLEILITVSVNEEETAASYEAVVYRDQQVVASQKVRVALGGA